MRTPSFDVKILVEKVHMCGYLRYIFLLKTAWLCVFGLGAPYASMHPHWCPVRHKDDIDTGSSGFPHFSGLSSIVPDSRCQNPARDGRWQKSDKIKQHLKSWITQIWKKKVFLDSTITIFCFAVFVATVSTDACDICEKHPLETNSKPEAKSKDLWIAAMLSINQKCA